ncbi:MAG: phosphatase PAP2 family protein [Opitutaceae bacterium]|jgi:membrane-associated PAP2 superfamily phosphatase|nr:phosphatase PAP2 family protein [Opitutaceae bacterium]
MSLDDDGPLPGLLSPRALPWAALALCGVVLFFECTDFDLPAQDLFFDFEKQKWLLPGPDESRLADVLFYRGPKILIIALGVLLVALAALPARIRGRLPRFTRRWRRVNLLVALLTLGTAPALVGFVKSATNVHYPCNIERYGGAVRYVGLLERFPPGARPARRSAGFPAGHASGGFALLGLAGVAVTRRGVFAALAAGLGAGWWMGLYQMARGMHYLSHTVVSMLLCWLVFLAWRDIARRAHNKLARPPGTGNCLPRRTESAAAP